MTTREFLTNLNACEEGLIAVGNEPLKDRWKKSVRGDWLIWLLGRGIGQSGWPSKSQVLEVFARCLDSLGRSEPAMIRYLERDHDSLYITQTMVDTITEACEKEPVKLAALCNVIRGAIEVPALDTLT